MDNKIKVSHVAIFLSVAIVIGILLGILLAPSTKNGTVYGEDKMQMIGNDKLSGVIQLILNDYVDTVSYEKLIDDAITNMLKELDPHSAYIPKTEFKAEKEEIEGNFEGIGIAFRMEEDTLYVIQALDKGPSKRAGILNGDRIITVNDSTIAGIKIKDSDIIKLLRGPKGTKVKLGVKRSGLDGLLYFTVKRDVIPSHSVSYSGMLTPEVGYIKLTKFSFTTYKELYEALKKLQAGGMQSLILDLRSNGGGLLEQAVAVADLFLPKDELIVYTRGRTSPLNESFSTNGGIFEEGKLVIMIDEFSASASEIVAGAVQDNDRGTIIGRRSFGKGLVQEQYEMPDGSALRLTTARYYTPSGRSIQRPYDKGTDEYYHEFVLRLAAEMENSKNGKTESDTTKYYTRKGRVVYGGGGIYPDIVLPYEKDSLITYYNELLQKGLLYKYAFDYTEKNRNVLLQKYATVEKFVQNFVVSKALFDDFVTYAEKRGIKKNMKSIQTYGMEIKTMLKTYVAQLLYGDEAFYKIYLSIDKDLQKAIHVINKK